MARIFARELNASDDLQQQVEISDAILQGSDLDVIEIDGASNRGVQEARDLIAASGLAPARCKYRIYIIDEVHMLTTPAFNALLKTMEEPPAHVKFILCTTEPHKVPATIQSRCQRFDFKSIPSVKIAAHLNEVLKSEEIETEPEVVAEVARLGNGSMRDALSILDRLLAGGSTSIVFADMEDALGLPSQTVVTQLCDAISSGEMNIAFESADALLTSGISLDRVLEIIAMTLRNALVSKVCGADTPLLEVSDESKIELANIGSQFDEATITHLIALCDASSRQVRRAGSGRALFDATIARLCLTGQLSEAGSVLSTTQIGTASKKKSMTARPHQQPVITTQKPSPPLVKKPTPIADSIPVQEITWEKIKSIIESTPGLKKIATHLDCSSLQDTRLVLMIAESGRDSTNYILGQRQRIESILTNEIGQKFMVVIESKVSESKESAKQSNFEDVENDELVQTARGLFGGTIIKVDKSPKADST